MVREVLSRCELILLCVLHAGLDLSLESDLQRLQSLGLMLAELPEREDLDYTALAKHHLLGEIGQVGDCGGHVGALRALPAREPCDDVFPEACACIGHGERGTALAVLGVDNVSAGILHMLVQVRDLLGLDGLPCLVLRKERQDRLTRMPTNHRNVDEVGVFASELAHKLVRSHNIKRGYSNDLQRIKALLLVELCHRWDNRIHRIHNHSEDRLRAELCTSLH
mmetsp:Transcript_50297/g.116771  ORF Transcript_50297/g.116771 Transcript_50297/m.116771 type:complete len:223 (+) Transcript_50297:617-1285(+)